MKVTKERILQRIDEVLEDNKGIVKDYSNGSFNMIMLEKSIFGAISIFKITYGEHSEQVKSLVSLREKYLKAGISRSDVAADIQFLINATLNTLKSDIEFDFLASLKSQVAGEIYGDFTSLAKKLIDEGHKEPAAVLACGALEDSMKKFAIKHGLNVYDQELSGVVNALKGAGLLMGTQAGVVQSYVKLRNKTFHAQFDKVEMPEVVSLIAFIEMFILQNFD